MAAGLGFKTFTTGEVLTAADTNGYLMQGINVFASTAARDAAITSPQEGQFAYTKDTNSLWYYTGSAWAASGATGDIEGVTAGVGITGGGTSGTVTITNDMATTITAAGDIVVGTGSGTYDNLPIGTTAQVLTADTTVSPYKVKWATPAVSTPTFRGVRLTPSADPSIANATFVATTWDTETYDTDAFHSTSSNTSRITIPTGLGGYYDIQIAINWAAAGSGAFYTSIYKNGSLVAGTYGGYDCSQRSPMYYSSTLNLSAADYIEAYVQQNSGGSKQYGSNANYAGMSYFQATYLGA